MSLFKTLIIAGFVGGVILLECVMAYLLIPSTTDIQAKLAAESGHGEKKDDGHGKSDKAGEHGGEDGDKKGHGDHHDDGPGTSEIELGKFNITIHKPSADITLRVNFHIIGTVKEEKHEEFTELLERNQHRLRDRIIFEIRNSDVADLTDPGLGLIKRRILAKSNELLGKPVLESVVFSEFSYSQL